MVKYSAQLDRVFGALSDTTRRAMVEQLINKGDQTLSELAHPHQMSLPAVSKHMKVLGESGMVTSRKVGRHRHYRVSGNSLDVLVEWLLPHQLFWSHNLDRLEKHLINNTSRKTERMAEDTKHALTITKVLNAPRERVFQAWTDPKEIAEWFGPEGFRNDVHEMDAREGGSYRLTMNAPDGKRYPLHGTFKTVQPPERLVMTWQWEQKNDMVDYTGETIVTVDLKEVPGGTELTLRHEGFMTEEGKKNHTEGWGSSLKDLERHLAA